MGPKRIVSRNLEFYVLSSSQRTVVPSLGAARRQGVSDGTAEASLEMKEKDGLACSHLSQAELC